MKTFHFTDAVQQQKAFIQKNKKQNNNNSLHMKHFISIMTMFSPIFEIKHKKSLHFRVEFFLFGIYTSILLFIIDFVLLPISKNIKLHHNFYILYIFFLCKHGKKNRIMKEKGNSNNLKFPFCIQICKQSILLVLNNFKCYYVLICFAQLFD